MTFSERPAVRTTAPATVQRPGPPSPKATPFAPGHSPFRVKGLGYRATVDRIQARLAGQGRTFRDVLPLDLALFFEQPFLASSLYDVFPVLPLVDLGARLEGTTMPAFVEGITREHARSDLSGVYRFILRVASPEAVAKRLPRLTAQYFDFGEVEDQGLVAPGLVRMVRTGVPSVLVEWYGVAACSYVAEVLTASGARDASARVVDVEAEGAAHGVPIRRMCFEFRWAP
jgi:hypothetical protein